MNVPLVTATACGLGGFAAWVWATGPGTSVPNALLAFAFGVLCGRLGWSLVDRRPDVAEAADDTAPDGTPDGTPRAPGISDARAWDPARAARTITLPERMARWDAPADPFGKTLPRGDPDFVPDDPPPPEPARKPPERPPEKP